MFSRFHSVLRLGRRILSVCRERVGRSEELRIDFRLEDDITSSWLGQGGGQGSERRRDSWSGSRLDSFDSLDWIEWSDKIDLSDWIESMDRANWSEFSYSSDWSYSSNMWPNLSSDWSNWSDWLVGLAGFVFNEFLELGGGTATVFPILYMLVLYSVQFSTVKS